MRSRAANRRHAKNKECPAIYLQITKTQEIEGKNNGNIEISENLLTSPVNENDKGTKTHKKLTNISAEMLKNIKFKDINNNCYLTRNVSRKLGLSSLSYLKSALEIK